MKKPLILLIFIFIFNFVLSQHYTINMGGTITTCSGNFYDSGGSTGNYGANENSTITFHSNNTSNTHIRVSFVNFNVEAGDTLIAYDGSNSSSTVLGKYNNNNLPPPTVQATINNLSGDLTFKFKSNGSVSNSGWYASLACTKICQQIVALLHPSLTIPAPKAGNFIDICYGMPITFAARGSGAAFPENQILYSQDSNNCSFLWDFGDGTSATGQIVTHNYNFVKGYNVGLKITDSRGCVDSNYLVAKVRISKSPFSQINPVTTLCSESDTAFVTIGYRDESNIVLQPVTPVLSASQIYDSTLFIPDGPSCPTQYLTSSLFFTDFASGSIITSANDILSVCVNMEHSFVGDLGFRIICPNGQSVQLDSNTHSGGAYLGVPYGGNNHAVYDNGCNAVNNPYGNGWTYCWSQTYSQHGNLDSLSFLAGAPIDSTNTINNSNYLSPDVSFSGLIGCPLNGVWSIEIYDDYSEDNGYFFWWKLNLNPVLLPPQLSFQVPIDTVLWAGSFITHIDDSTIMVTPHSEGTYYYTVTVIDDFGCSYDTTFTIIVNEAPEISVTSPNNYIYSGGSTALNASGGISYFWNPATGLNSVNGAQVNASPAENTTYFVTGTDTYGCSNVDSINVYVYCSHCPDSVIFETSGFFTNGCINHVYNNSSHCKWLLFPSGASKVFVSFDEFDILPGDKIRVWQGSDTTGVLKGTFDNNNRPPDSITTTVPMLVELITNSSDVASGFKANYWTDINGSVNENSGFIKSFNLYPNPADKIIYFELSQKAMVEICNLSGQCLMNSYKDVGLATIDISLLTQGMYFIKVISENGIAVKKFVKEQ